MDQKTLDVYNALAEHHLQSFFVAFHQILNVNQKRDFVLVCRRDLHCIGLTSRSSINNFEKLLKSIRHSEESKNCSFDFTQFYIDTILPNQEPVIIGSNDVTQEEILGCGNFGKVYKGTWQRKTQDGKAVKVPVAIKTLSDGTEMSWKKEVSIFTALNQNHSSIIKFCGLLIGDEDKIQMVAEFAALGSLLDRLRGKDITSIATLSQFSVQISSGMVFLHSRNLVHRDLSARNILVTAKNQVKVSDFGLSKVVDDKNKEWVMDGAESLPMRWLAPESINNGVFTTSSDVWSFAVVLWEMFTFGDVPWSEQNNEQVKLKIQNGECLPEPKLCPGSVYDVMKMCFCHDSQSRPSFHRIKEELIKRQPLTYEATSQSTGRYDLNFDVGDFVTSIKPISDSDFWLGQHEDSLLFGRFHTSHTKLISYTIPYSLIDDQPVAAEEELEEEGQQQQQQQQIEDSDMLMRRFRPASSNRKEKENHRYETVFQPSDEDACYVNMSPPSRPPPSKPSTVAAVVDPCGEPHYQTPKPITTKTKTTAKPKKSPVESLKMEESKQQRSQRPHSEVLSSRKEFFDLSPNNANSGGAENSSGQLKSGSDSRILFKDTKPDVQNKVMERIAKNMTAFLTLTDETREGTTESADTHGYLNPIDVSSVKPRPNKHLDSLIMAVDPYAKSKSASCENVYSEIGTGFSSNDNNQIKRPRPKGTLQHQDNTKDTPSPYRKSSLDAYASSVKKDFELLAERIGTKPSAVSSDPLPGVSDSMKVSVDELKNCPDVRNKRYLAKFDSVIPLAASATAGKTNEIVQQRNLQGGSLTGGPTSVASVVGSTNVGSYPYAPPGSFSASRFFQVNNTQQQHVDIQHQRSPDYYNNFVLDQKRLNHFTYDPNSVPNLNRGSPENLTTKGKSRLALSNYTSNNWDLFDDCVKDPKKLEKNRVKNNTNTTTAKEISWPTDNQQQNSSPQATNESKMNAQSTSKEEFSAKFQKIRSVLPEISVSECLEGLRYSDHNVERAIRFIQVQKLTRANYGFSSEECEKLFNDCECDFVATENLLKTKYVKSQFGYLSETQVRETLQVCNWNTILALKTIFVQKCNDFGLPESKAMSIFSECQENVTKALEMAKIVRVAEITSQPEHYCFKILTHCRWDLERTVNHILSSKSTK